VRTILAGVLFFVTERKFLWIAKEGEPEIPRVRGTG
jgi:hypothetical protein